MRQLYEQKQCKYCHGQIDESKGNMKKLWRAFHSVLGEATSGDVQELTSDDFAVSSETRLSRSVRASTASTPLYDVPHKATPTLEEWTTVTSDEVEMLISSALCKSCQLDPAREGDAYTTVTVYLTAA